MLVQMDTLLGWLTQYGYAGLFVLLMLGIVGLPIPDETLLLFCGYLIFRGRLNALPAFFSGFSGSLCGISLSYYLGRRFGSRFQSFRRVHQVNRLFSRIGPWVLTIGYFILGVRHFTAIVAGSSGLPYRRFAAFAYSGAALWVGTFLGLGYFFGESWEHTSALVHRCTLIATAAAAVIAAIVWLIRRARVKWG